MTLSVLPSCTIGTAGTHVLTSLSALYCQMPYVAIPMPTAHTTVLVAQLPGLDEVCESVSFMTRPVWIAKSHDTYRVHQPPA